MNKRVWVHEGETEVAREMIQTVREGERERETIIQRDRAKSTPAKKGKERG